MKPHLLYPDRDMAWRSALEAAEIREKQHSGKSSKHSPSEPPITLPWNAPAFERDLNLGTLFGAMADNDELIFMVARTIILNAMENDTATIRYRQAVLQDCIDHADTVRTLYDLAVDAGEKGQQYMGLTLSRYPDWMLRHSISVLEALLDPIERIRKIADTQADHFPSAGWRSFFAVIREELCDERVERMRRHLTELQLRDGVLMSAGLGPGNKGTDYTLNPPPRKSGGRLMQYLRRRFPRFFDRAPSDVFDFAIDPRDEAGARALQDVKNRAIAIAADSVGQAADHVRDFFAALRCELAFYLGCLNLYDILSQAHHYPLCMPTPQRMAPHRLAGRGVYDACLVLAGRSPVIGNDLDANGKNPIIVTGANQGGKSTFLRSIGLAQLMMQAGMFVPAESFDSSVCDGLFTHFKREEDAGLKSGKLEEELARMSEIVEHLPSHPIVLCNESFAATNEREGSEIARQVSTALLERSIRLVYVTHLHEFAQAMHETGRADTLFLRADRQEDGTRTYKIEAGEPLQTSFGEDLYARIFSSEQKPQHGITDEVER